VAGADEAGRGSLAGPLVVAGVLLDYGTLRGARVRPLAGLNDSKQVEPEEREALFHAVAGCAAGISVRIVPVASIDRDGLHRSNLAALRAVLADLRPPAEACLVDGFRLGPAAPPHRAIVEGDARSAAIAAASIVAKVVRDRVMRRLDALYPRYGFSSHVGYITPGHSAAVRAFGPSELHRRSFQAACYEGGPGETGAVPVGSAGRRDAASLSPTPGVAPIRRVWALPASLPCSDRRKPTDEASSARPSAA
jgi:ribonuclease HII